MLITVDQSSFLSALQTAQRGSSSQSTLPILAGIKIEAEKDGFLVLHGTDLELSIKVKCPASIEREGSTVIPGKLIVDIVKFLPQGAISIESEEGKNDIEIKSAKASFKLKGMAPEDFPTFPIVEEKKKATLEARQLIEMIKCTIKAISRDETRPVLTGSMLKVEDKNLLMVATDSYRLAVKTMSVKLRKADNMSLLIPYRAIEETQKLLAEERGKIEVTSDDNLMRIGSGEKELVTRLIEGQYPDYKQLIPKETKIGAEVIKEELIDAIKRVSLMAQKNMSIKISIEEEGIRVQAATQGIGEASELVKAKIKGANISEIAFNAQFLVDGLQAMTGEKARVEFTGSVNPGLIKSTSKEDYLYLLMPIRIS
ncbi:MAG TPA: DNA polymerase III subunit beta [Actinobacteria bacterium]|nr:DNA polymerase III subunit beta [Actinomycetota bacterium]